VESVGDRQISDRYRLGNDSVSVGHGFDIGLAKFLAWLSIGKVSGLAKYRKNQVF
jgi:hypothetical protein